MRNTHNLFLLLAVILLAGCGGTSPTATTPAGPTKITFWYGLSGHNGVVVQDVIKKYNQSQTKYVVEGIFQSSYDDTLSKFNASLSGTSTQLPNVVQIYDIGTQRMIDTKKIVPVQTLVERDHLQNVVDDLEPAIRSYYTIGGKLDSMPFNSSTAVMYFDKNAFRQVGLDTTKKIWTYDEVLAAAKKLTVKGSRAGVAFYNYAWLFEQELSIANQLHSSPDNGRLQRATKYAFNNPAGVQWLDFQKQLLSDGSAQYFAANQGAGSSAAFLSGKAAITFESIASLRGFTDTAKKNGGKVDIGVAYMPRPAAAQGRTIIGGASLWVTNTGSTIQQEGAWDFIKFAVQPDTQAFWSSNTGYVPVRLSTYNLPEMKTALAQFPQFQVAIDEIRSAPPTVYNAGSVTGNLLTVRNGIQAATDKYLTGKVSSPQTALDQAVQTANSTLSEYNTAAQ